MKQKVLGLADFGLNPGKADVFVSTNDDASWVGAWNRVLSSRQSDALSDVSCRAGKNTCRKALTMQVILLDPGKAFGTGTHPTTKLALLGLESAAIRGGEKMIDVGTGSGVLSIAACKLGAKEALAYDVDDEAIEACDVNLKLNPEERSKIHVATNDLLNGVDEKADLICANILAEIIVPLIPQAFNCLNDGGIFITSGIISDKADLIEEKLQNEGFVIDQISRMKDWFSIVAHKPGEGEE